MKILLKTHKIVNRLILVLLITGISLVYSCREELKSPVINIAEEVIDLPQIRERGKLIVVTDFNSINYFIYKGQPMGFQYELLQELSDHLNLELEVRVNNDLEQNFESLIKGEIDLIASNLTVTGERKKRVAFTEPHSQSSQVLIQRIRRNRPDLEPLRNPMQLAGKRIYVKKQSSYSSRLRNLSEEIGEDIDIQEMPLETEQMIRMVANGEIDYTVADENVARVNTLFYPDIDIKTTISFPQNQAWAVRMNSTLLKEEIDQWLKEFKKSRLYAVLKNKYFDNPRSAVIVNSEYYYLLTGRISAYDEILKYESTKIGWDWRLLSSMAYQESRFNPGAVSWAGAFGIMQLMPGTAQKYGVNQNSSPAENIRAGVKYILWLKDRFKDKVPDEGERIKFILAAYNIGYGHIIDAIRLAEKYGKDPTVWKDNVEACLLKKSQPEYYTDPVVKYGYRKASETCKYVDEILQRYQHYLNLETLAAR